MGSLADLRGTRMRSLRRELRAARSSGVRIELLDDAMDVDWSELESVNTQWLASRARRVEIKRATRRCPLEHEKHCTKLIARDADGETIAWAAFDHLYSGGVLVGGGFSTVRYVPHAPPGVTALLAYDGVQLLYAHAHEHHGTPVVHSPDDFVLALGESPMAETASLPSGPGVAPEDLSSRARSGFLARLFRVLYRIGGRLYNTRGISEWKRKWRAPVQTPLYCAVEGRPPLRETVATMALIL